MNEALPEQSIDAGRLFDEIVHRGTDPNVLLAGETEPSETWEVVALPRSATPP
jgi:hypothetical protein